MSIDTFDNSASRRLVQETKAGRPR